MSKQVKYSIILTVLIFSLAACSLNYGNEESTESTVPEFSFKNANFNRYDNSKLTIIMHAERLEQYKSGGTSFAANTSFSTFSKKGELETEGSCKLLSAYTDDKKYSLFDEIIVNMHKDNMKLQATTLQFNGKTEQLTSSINDEVIITKKDTTISGRGFAASGVSKTFAFNQDISGQVIEDKTSGEQEQSSIPEDDISNAQEEAE